MRSSTNNPRVSPAQYTATPATTCTVASTCDGEEESSIYVRAWRFVQRRLHLRPRAISCPVGMETAKTVEEPQNRETKAVGSSSFCSDWQRVYMLKELEEAGARAQWRRQLQIKETAEWAPTDVPEQPTFRTQAQRKTAQMTCYNCGLLFFRPMSVASDTSAFCGRDCQSTFEYRRDLQDAVNECETFRSTVTWTQSNVL